MIHRAKGIRLTDQQRLCWLQLTRCENVGPVTFHQLIAHFGTAEKALDALPELAAKGGTKRKIRMATREDALQEMAMAERLGIRFVGIGEPDYPPLLKTEEGAPPLIAVKGNPAVLSRDCVAIVGSRNASAAGQRITEIFAHGLGEAGFTIISGLARGIDGAAHHAALKTKTIAVLAGGVDRIYPPEHQALYHDILAHDGAIISEMPVGFTQRAIDFPRRNRLVAGISRALLVVEAAQRSGSLISARLAGEMGRLVFAVPGSPLDPRAAGTNHLIRDGATLATGPQDIIEALVPLIPAQKQQFSFLDEDMPHDEENKVMPYDKEDEPANSPPLSAEDHSTDGLLSDHKRTALLQALSPTPVSLEMLTTYCGLSLPEIYMGLIELDIAGRIIRYSGGRVALAPVNDQSAS